MPVEQQIAVLYCGTHGLLKDVPGTAEDWLKKVEFYRPAHVILRRLER